MAAGYRTLITGFGPFGTVVSNPAERIVEALRTEQIPGHDLTLLTLPTAFRRAPELIRQALLAGSSDGRPFDFVLMLGVSAGSPRWRVECFGRNRDDPSARDIDGNYGSKGSIDSTQPDLLAATLPVSSLVEALQSAGCPAVASDSAGSFLCNNLLFTVLAALRQIGGSTRAGFLHIPADEQTFRPGVATATALPFAQHLEAVRAVLARLAADADAGVPPLSGTEFPLQSYLETKRAAIEDALDRCLPPTDRTPKRLHESIRYSMLAPGKRLRPTLVIAAAEAVGGSAESVLPTACALECIHVFSLIHDDLPCMDNDDYRRGRLTNHKVFGEAMALLAGDALLALAYQLIAENAAQAPADRVLPTLRLVAEAAGARGMVGGQVVDMESQGQEVDAERLRFIHAHKTGALLSASVLAGATLAGATPEQITALQSYGGHIGLAFQIADDILDVAGDEARIGKPVGSDAERDKATYPRLYGLEESRRRAHAEVEAALAVLAGFDRRAEPLRSIARFIVERDL